jgi:TPR repeat protein
MLRPYYTIFLALFFLNSTWAQDNRFDAGLAALKRGHYATAMRAWIKMADEGVAEAQNNVGHLYEEGFGVAQDYPKAMSWYKKAAEQGLAEAQHNIGMLYYEGYGVKKNYREAVKWFKLATAQKLPDAQYMLALAYHQGQGVTMNYKFAKVWYLESAKQGYANAQFMYAFMLQAGDLGEPDPLKALAWSEVARRNGREDSSDIGDLSKLQLTEEEIAKASQLAELCLSSNYKSCPTF